MRMEMRTLTSDVLWTCLGRIRGCRQKLGSEPMEMSELAQALQIAEEALAAVTSSQQEMFAAGWDAAMSYLSDHPRHSLGEQPVAEAETEEDDGLPEYSGPSDPVPPQRQQAPRRRAVRQAEESIARHAAAEPKKTRRRRRTKAEMQAAREAEARAKEEKSEKAPPYSESEAEQPENPGYSRHDFEVDDHEAFSAFQRE